MRWTIMVLPFLLWASTAFGQSYGPYSQETYTLCTPSAPATRSVVLLHGGDWLDSTGAVSAQDAVICEELAADGVEVVMIGYRGSNTSPWPAMEQDVQLAIRWTRQKYGLPTCAVGTSAGAHLTLMLGAVPLLVNAATDPQNEAGLLPTFSSLPDCLVSWSAPTNLVALYDSPPSTWDAPAYIAKLIGVTTPTSPQLEALSPAYQYLASMPPTFVLHGNNDPLIPVTQATTFFASLEASRSPSGADQLVLTPGKHVLGGLTKAEDTAYAAEITAWMAVVP